MKSLSFIAQRLYINQVGSTRLVIAIWSSHGPVTLALGAERFVVELSLFVLTVCRGWDSNTQPSTCAKIKSIHYLFTQTFIENYRIL